MMPSDNLCVIASAGSRKTTFLIEEAIKNKTKKVLITTYTNENLGQIESYIIEKLGCVPKNITIMSWYTFLLQEGVRPYQNQLTQLPRVISINFVSQRSIYTKKTNIDSYFFDRKPNLYRDTASDLVVLSNAKTGGMVIRRLEGIYDHIYVDEVQDLAGYDLEVLELLLKSSIHLILVGDPRQTTFSTNNSSKNKRFKRAGIIDWFEEKKKAGLCVLEERIDCFRCNQLICDFADALHPSLSKTNSKNIESTGHDGIFEIKPEEVEQYIKTYQPVILRHNKSMSTLGNPATNIGITKGKTYDRVLIFPTNPMKKYLQTKDLSKAGDIAKLYVAVTRARHSVTFVV